MQRSWKVLAGIVCFLFPSLGSTQAQTNSYKQTNLVSDSQVTAPNTDAKLVNPWGIAFIPGQPFWISDNNSGFTTLYNQHGNPLGTFLVAPPPGSSNPATPTGIVAPPSNVNFNVAGQASIFIFDTEDGTISGWTGATPASAITVDNSKIPSPAQGAVYKGLAFIQNTTGNFLLGTNFRSGKVEVYDTGFQQTQVLGPTAFNDPALPAVPAGSGSPGYAPFGIHTLTINGQRMVLVTYALQDTPMHDPLHMAGSGVVDLFNADGSMARRVTADAHLNAPWGAVVPPPGFGAFDGKLLVGNFGDGVINAYDLTSGNFIDQMKDANGAVVTNPSLWDMVFDASGATGDLNTMYITAGLTNEQHGLFAAITANAATAPPTADFSIGATPATLTIAAGNPAVFTVTLGGLSGFNSVVNLNCSGQPAGSSCSFAPASVSPASGGTATTTLTIHTSSSPYMPAAVTAQNQSGGLYAMLLPVPALALLAVLLVGSGGNGSLARKNWGRSLAISMGLLIATTLLLAVSGCGAYSAANNSGNGTQRGAVTVVVTGTSGNLSHSTSITLTVQ